MNKYIESLLQFMDAGVCNFLAVDTIKQMLSENGFSEKRIEQPLQCRPGDKFFVTKNSSAIFAIKVGSRPINETGFKIITAPILASGSIASSPRSSPRATLI